MSIENMKVVYTTNTASSIDRTRSTMTFIINCYYYATINQ